MSTPRRQFLKGSALGLASAALARTVCANADPQAPSPAPATPPGMPPAFGTGPSVGPEVTPATIAEAEKLMQVTLTPAERHEFIDLASKLEPRAFAVAAADHVSPLPLPKKLLSGRGSRRSASRSR